MMKNCFKCFKRKEINQFYKHNEMGDGYLGKCKMCTKKDVESRYYDPKFSDRIKKYERQRFKNPHRKLKIKLYQQKRRNNSPGKYRIRQKTSNAVRDGRLIKKPCAVCNSSKSQAHHLDYRSYINVKWLCFKHHRMEHGQMVV